MRRGEVIMRMFFAVMLPPELQKQLGELKNRLAWLPVRGNWTAVENLHLTLKFLGEVPEGAVMDLVQAIREQAPLAQALTLQPDRLLYFPSAGAARVVGVGVSGETQNLQELQGHIEMACEQLGFTREMRPYIPHATLARFRDGLQERHKGRIANDVSGIFPLPAFAMTQYQLMQSILDNRSPRYEVVARFPAS